MSYNQQLKEFLKLSGLNASQLSKIINKSEDTIKSWLANSHSNKFRNLSYQSLIFIKSQVLMNQNRAAKDIEYLLADHNFSAEYHLKNAINITNDMISKFPGLDAEITKSLEQNLSRALDDLSLSNQFIQDFLPTLKVNLSGSGYKPSEINQTNKRMDCKILETSS